MDEQEIIIEKRKRDPKLCIIAVQVVCVTIVLAAVIVIKLLFGDLYDGIEKWYEENFETETSISEVLEMSSGGDNNEI